jgi:hypothetical protein
MKTGLLSAAGAFALAAVAFTGSAQAQCWWSGMGYSCAAPTVVESRFYEPAPVWGTPYPAWNAYDYQDYRLRPYWLPSYPGPRPGGH